MPYHTIRTWEWSAVLPVRSIVPAFATTGIPVWFAKVLSSEKFCAGTVMYVLHGLFRETLDTGSASNPTLSTRTVRLLTLIWADR